MRRTVRSAGRVEYEQVGRQLKDLREKQGLTLRQLAAKLGYSHSRLVRIETGSQPIDLVSLIDVAHALGTTAWELLKTVEDTGS